MGSITSSYEIFDQRHNGGRHEKFGCSDKGGWAPKLKDYMFRNWYRASRATRSRAPPPGSDPWPAEAGKNQFCSILGNLLGNVVQKFVRGGFEKAIFFLT